MDHASRAAPGYAASAAAEFIRPSPSICRRSPKACVRSRSASLVRAPSTEAMTRAYERARDAEAAAAARTAALEKD